MVFVDDGELGDLPLIQEFFEILETVLGSCGAEIATIELCA